jgi:hypothetical protein
VAVVIAAEAAEFSNLQFNSEFWYDTVLTYCMLRKNRFQDEDIYVLYGDGSDPQELITTAATSGTNAVVPPPSYYRPDEYCGQGYPRITDLAMTPVTGETDCRSGSTAGERCMPKKIFGCLKDGCPGIPRLSENDYLFVWWKGHGAWLDSDFVLKMSADYVKACDLLTWIAEVRARERLLIFEACEAGCLEQALGTEPKGILLASSECGMTSHATKRHDVWHGVFSFWIDGTLAGLLPPGSSNPMNPGSVYEKAVEVSPGQSVEHSFLETAEATEYEIGPTPQIPVRVDHWGLAPQTYLSQIKILYRPCGWADPRPCRLLMNLIEGSAALQGEDQP